MKLFADSVVVLDEPLNGRVDGLSKRGEFEMGQILTELLVGSSPLHGPVRLAAIEH